MPFSKMTAPRMRSPEKEQPLRFPAVLQMLGRAAMYGCTHLSTTYNRPATLFGMVEKEAAGSPHPLHPNIATTIENTKEVLTRHTIAVPERFSVSDKIMRSARMIQFTDRFAGHEQAFFDYSTMITLKDRFMASAQQQAYPLSFDQQLDIALELANGDVIEGLTDLWFASRQYARWFDSVSICNLPEFTTDEIVTEIREWRSTILACKSAEEVEFQDPAGDSYYAWTHALARVMYGSSSGLSDRVGRFLFSHGTAVNTQAHRFIKQSIPSDHTIAAAYGNRIGDVILEAAKRK